MKHKSKTIIGAVAGDVIGSVYEWNNARHLDFELLPANAFFTDDTVLTIAVADCILNQKDFGQTIWRYGNDWPNRGYGGRFAEWLRRIDRKPYESFGNGSAMRASAVGFAFESLEEVLAVAKQSADCTHNHPEGIKGAQATAAAIFLARNGHSQADIKKYIEATFSYDLNFTIEVIRPTYQFNETCQETVPQAIVAFLESTSFENAIRLAISVGGDSDTIACITGGIAAAFYPKIPDNILDFVAARLPDEFIQILNEFDERIVAA